MDDDNWDLHAVVRSCRFTGSAATTDPFSSFPPPSDLKAEEVAPLDGEEGGGGIPLCFPDMSESRSVLLEDLWKPFFPEVQQQPQLSGPSSPPSSAALAFTSAASLVPAVGATQQQHSRQPHRPPSQISRPKRRKNQQKRVVCHVPADGLSSDMWAWRKYGQKPIKGSPYPRGYYRCSSSKGCLARKQVERSRTDPAMFVITYTAEHNHPMPTHRNSLAGSTRQKFPPPPSSTTPPPATGGEAGDGEHLPPVNPSSSPPSSSTAAGLSPTTPLTASMEDELLRREGPTKREDGGEVDDDEEEEEEGMLLVEDMEVMGEDGLLFLGLDEPSGAPTTSAATSTAATEAVASTFFDDDGDFEEHFFPPPWLSNSNNNAAAAAGGS